MNYFTPHVGQRVACIKEDGTLDLNRLATILRCRKRARTVTNVYGVRVRLDHGEEFDSVNGCWHPIDGPPVRCPHCGSDRLRLEVAQWTALSQFDPHHSETLGEHCCVACHRSFWT